MEGLLGRKLCQLTEVEQEQEMLNKDKRGWEREKLDLTVQRKEKSFFIFEWNRSIFLFFIKYYTSEYIKTHPDIRRHLYRL